jgi:hypothetical protein
MATTLASFEAGHGDMVHDVALDYYGRRLATASSDRCIKVFDVVGEQVGRASGSNLALRMLSCLCCAACASATALAKASFPRCDCPSQSTSQWRARRHRATAKQRQPVVLEFQADAPHRR